MFISKLMEKCDLKVDDLFVVIDNSYKICRPHLYSIIIAYTIGFNNFQYVVVDCLNKNCYDYFIVNINDIIKMSNVEEFLRLYERYFVLECYYANQKYFYKIGESYNTIVSFNNSDYLTGNPYISLGRYCKTQSTRVRIKNIWYPIFENLPTNIYKTNICKDELINATKFILTGEW